MVILSYCVYGRLLVLQLVILNVDLCHIIYSFIHQNTHWQRT